MPEKINGLVWITLSIFMLAAFFFYKYVQKSAEVDTLLEQLDKNEALMVRDEQDMFVGTVSEVLSRKELKHKTSYGIRIPDPSNVVKDANFWIIADKDFLNVGDEIEIVKKA